MSRLSPGLRARLASDSSIWPVVSVVVLISIYPVLRYGGWWTVGGDTLNFTIAIRSVLESGEIAPTGRQIYPNGYGYQVLSVFLLHLSGVSLPHLQIFGGVLLVTWLVFPAWLLFREWVGSGRGATLATVLLFAQPDFLFVVMRGTHEKFTRGLMLLCLYLLTYSLRSRNTPRRFAASVVAFYLLVFALITFNNFFSTSFIVAIFFALGIYALVAWRFRQPGTFEPAIRRMAMAGVTSLVLAFVYTFYIYDLAGQNLSVLATIVERIRELFQQSSSEAVYNPYSETVLRGWISPYIYIIMNLANGLFLLGAGIIWLSQGMRWLRGREQPSSLVALLPWVFFAAFAFQGVLAVLSDFSGALTANLQHRMIASIGFVGAPLFARWLLSTFDTWRGSFLRVAQAGVWGLIGLLLVLGMTKASNDPMLSNQWQTYLPAELEAVAWAEETLSNRGLWVGLDRRVVEAVDTRSGGSQRNVLLDQLSVDAGTRDFMISDLTRQLSLRVGATLPMQFDDFVTYDSGEVKIMHRRPRTPYHP